jgi:cyclohexyl-isocyanide hydratase
MQAMPRTPPPIAIGFLIFPGVTELDATGPAQVLARVPGAKIHMIWRNLEPVVTDAGFSIVPTDTYVSCPALDVICVPGGGGQLELMADEPTLTFLSAQASTAKYVTAVCTGSLLLAAAGALEGYRAACHWAWRDLLAELGVEPVAERIVRDRNRITGGGVTAGIDFGLLLAAELTDAETARMIQLYLEYAPEPPFDCGTPERAGAERVALVRESIRSSYAERKAALAAARRARLNTTP